MKQYIDQQVMQSQESTYENTLSFKLDSFLRIQSRHASAQANTRNDAQIVVHTV